MKPAFKKPPKLRMAPVKPTGTSALPRQKKWIRAAWAAGIVCVIVVGVIVGQTFWNTDNGDNRKIRLPAGVENDQAPVFPSASAQGSNANPMAALTEAKQRDGAAAQLNLQANKLLKDGDAQGAVKTYQQALVLTPKDEDLHFNLGIAYAQAGDLTNAEHEYREALNLLPDYPEVRNNLGNLLLRAGRIAEAEEQFTEALKAMPEYAQAHNNLGIIRQKQSRFDEALECFQKAVEYDTNYWQAHFNLASAYLRQTNREKAVAELRETLRINPKFETAQKFLAKALGQEPAPGP